MKQKRTWKMVKKIVLPLTILGFLFIHFYAPRFITEIKNPLVEVVKGNHATTASPSFENNQLKGKHIIFKSFDQVELSGYLTYSNLDTAKGTIVLLHGIRSTKECFVELSKQLALMGYHSVALDSRAHGQSKGVHCTFGVKEKKDVSALIDVLEKQDISQNIGVWGQSLGGAIGIQAMGYDERIKFGIIESTFSDFRTITNDYFSYFLGFNIPPLTNYLVDRAGEIAGFNPAEAQPLIHCKQIEQPLLMVHGAEDQRININYAKDNFANIAGQEKTFLEIENAAHLDVWNIGGEAYFERVMRFITNNTINVVTNEPQ